MASSISLAHQASLRISSPSQSVGRFDGARSSSVRVSCFHSPSIGHPLRLSRSLNMRCAAASPETLKKVVDIVTKQLAATEGSVKPESKFEELGADSLDQVEIVMALEEDFEISIDEQGSEAIKTVQDAADLIEKTKSVKVDA